MLWPALENGFLVCQQGTSIQKSVEGIGSDVRVPGQPSVPRRRSMSSMSAYHCPVHQSFYMVLSLAWSVLQAVLYAALAAWSLGFASRWLWQGCFFSRSSWISYLLRQTSLGLVNGVFKSLSLTSSSWLVWCFWALTSTASSHHWPCLPVDGTGIAVYWEALLLPRLLVDTVLSGKSFQYLMVFGKKEDCLYWLWHWIKESCCKWPLLWQATAGSSDWKNLSYTTAFSCYFRMLKF